jgi:hypothetical protein
MSGEGGGSGLRAGMVKKGSLLVVVRETQEVGMKRRLAIMMLCWRLGWAVEEERKGKSVSES